MAGQISRYATLGAHADIPAAVAEKFSGAQKGAFSKAALRATLQIPPLAGRIGRYVTLGAHARHPGGSCRKVFRGFKGGLFQKLPCGKPCRDTAFGGANKLIRYFGCSRPTSRRLLPESFQGVQRGGFFKSPPFVAPMLKSPVDCSAGDLFFGFMPVQKSGCRIRSSFQRCDRFLRT